jgi:hypothetical protein
LRTAAVLLLVLGGVHVLCPAGAPTVVAAAQPAASSANLLAGKQPTRSQDVSAAALLTDGLAVIEGDAWETDGTARFASTQAFVEYDLGAEQRIAAAWLQGDANDTYELSVSNDGSRFLSIWHAPTLPGSGVRTRSAIALDSVARYVRIRPAFGDRALALSEVQLFSSAPAVFPPDVPRIRGVALDQFVRDKTLLFGFALALAVALARRDAPRWQTALLLVLVAAAGAWLWLVLAQAWPVTNREVSLVRAVLAAAALCAVAREALSPPRYPAHRGVTFGVLGLCAAGAFVAFYNLGNPQFFNHAKGAPTFAHQPDLRQYYPTAKYFQELGYRGIYEADVLALMEDGGTNLETLGGLRMRDLYTFQHSAVRYQRERIEARRARFSPERWQEYRADARYFREAIGVQFYSDTLLDYGGNATPLWMSVAHLLFTAVPPSDLGFTLTGLFDAVLVLGTFFAIYRTFGARTALVCAVVFGANDFIMYGSNWSGATLRHDWLAALGLAVCALRKERWTLGGALIGVATMIRAFPVLALFGVGTGILWSTIEQIRAHRRLPAFRELASRNQALLRVLAGAASAAAACFAFSILVLPSDAWAEWYVKVTQLDADPHPATISLRILLGGWEQQYETLKGRAPLYVAAFIGYVALTVWACRGKRPEQAAVLGLALLPVVFSPANYYMHVVYLLPLLVLEQRAESSAQPMSTVDAGVWLTVLGLCALQYFTVLVAELFVHFYLATALYFAAFTMLLMLLVSDSARAWLWAEQPALAPAPDRAPPDESS